MPRLSFSPPIPDRRNQRSRDALVTRVVAEFEEMPCLRLTGRQAQRLFDLRADVCQRLLGALQRDGTLACDTEQRYRLNDSKSSRGRTALVGSLRRITRQHPERTSTKRPTAAEVVGKETETLALHDVVLPPHLPQAELR
jgi:hypothetical protein